MDTRAYEDLTERARQFSLDIIGLAASVPESTAGRVLAERVLQSGTQVGAGVRRARRVRSGAEYVGRIEGVLQELDDTVYWLELLVTSRLVPAAATEGLATDAEELAAVLVHAAQAARAAADPAQRSAHG